MLMNHDAMNDKDAMFEDEVDELPTSLVPELPPVEELAPFCNLKFENTCELSISFFICTGCTGVPVESQWHLLFTMADDPLSISHPPSLPTGACSTNTGIKDVPMNEKTTEIGQK